MKRTVCNGALLGLLGGMLFMPLAAQADSSVGI